MKYELPEFEWKNTKEKISKILEDAKNSIILGALFLLLSGVIVGVSGGAIAVNYFPQQTQALFSSVSLVSEIQTQIQAQAQAPVSTKSNDYASNVSYEQAIINAVKSSTNSVVSIIISKNLPVYEQQFVNPFGAQYVQTGTRLQEIGAGSGFIVSSDGLVLTNKHVVSDSTAQYTVFTNDGSRYTARVLALDPVQDLAVVKIEGAGKTFQAIKLGDSDGIQVGQTAIAIGNALGQFSNTISVCVVSGLERTVSASDRIGGSAEVLQGIIQTDAAINSGNSGGPLLNLKGEVIGINTAMAQGAQSIGFAIPINMAKRDISQVQATNKIVYPFLGVRYVLVNSQVQEQYNLSVDYGVLVLRGAGGEPAITAGSPAQAAGIQENDVILMLDEQKITTSSPLSNIILKHNPGDTVSLTVLRNGNEIKLQAILTSRSS